MKKNIYDVTAEEALQRLDLFLASKSGLTRSHIRKLITHELVLVNDRVEKQGYTIKYGDRIELEIDSAPEDILLPEEIPLHILHEDDHIIVINKPPGMVIYPAAGNSSGTMMNALAAWCNKLASKGAPLRPGVVHRLDKDTSGTIIVAKDDESYYSLVDQFRNRDIEKQYMALLFGSLKEDAGEIKASIGRSLSNRKKMSTRAKRSKEAITRYEVVQRLKFATLARIRIITGRTHQIRVHFASVGHPVLGDSTYGKKTSLHNGQKTVLFKRQLLHAHTLKLTHPFTDEVMEFKSPLPGDMAEAINTLSG